MGPVVAPSLTHVLGLMAFMKENIGALRLGDGFLYPQFSRWHKVVSELIAALDELTVEVIPYVCSIHRKTLQPVHACHVQRAFPSGMSMIDGQ